MLPSKTLAVFIALIFINLPTRGNCQELMIDQVRKTVVYLQGQYECHEPHIVNGVQALAADGTPVFDTACLLRGTGFIVTLQIPELGPGRGVPVLVTSKHILRHPRLGAPNGVTEYFDTINAFANSIQPNAVGSYIAQIPVRVKVNGFLFCSIDNQDSDADIAVCPIPISDSKLDFMGIGPDMFVTQSTIEVMKLNETDEVLFSGLFLPYHGANKNYPIVRHGRLALIPKERIPWSISSGGYLMQDLYLAEITSWGGNSGSPVFVRLSGTREPGGTLFGVQYLLLGVMQGYFNSERPATLDTAAITDTAHFDLKFSENSGIAAIVPAQKILDIIAQPRMKAYVSAIKAISLGKAGRAAEADSSFKEAISTLRETDPEHPLLKEILMEYIDYLRNAGRFPEANFQQRSANLIDKISTTPDDLLR